MMVRSCSTACVDLL